MFYFFLLLLSIINCKAFIIFPKPVIYNSKKILMIDQIQEQDSSKQAKQKWLESLNHEPSWLQNKKNLNNEENILMISQINANQRTEQWKQQAKEKWLESLNHEPSWLQNKIKKETNNEENYLNNAKLNILEAKKLIIEANNQILEAESNMVYLFKNK